MLGPLRLVDGVNPSLSLKHNAAPFVNIVNTALAGGFVAGLLRGLDGDGAVLAIAGVDLLGGLVGSNVESDAGGRRRDVDDGDHAAVRVVGLAVVDEAGVHTGAVVAADAVGVVEVLADLLAGGVVDGAVRGVADLDDGAVGHENVITGDVARGHGHV